LSVCRPTLDIRCPCVIVHTMNHSDPTAYEIPDHQVEQFHDTITRLFQCCQERMQYQSDKFAMPDAEMRCLMLFANKRYLTAKNIAYHMNVVKSRVSKLLDGLAEKGLVRKVRDPADSRVALISLTREGREKIFAIASFQNLIYKEVLGHMAPQQRKVMISNLELLKASMESAREMMV